MHDMQVMSVIMFSKKPFINFDDLPEDCPSVLVKLMESCMVRNPEDRPSFQGIHSNTQTWQTEIIPANNHVQSKDINDKSLCIHDSLFETDLFDMFHTLCQDEMEANLVTGMEEMNRRMRKPKVSH